MRERTPSADDTPKRAPPAPPREAASADVSGSQTTNGTVEAFHTAKHSPGTVTSSSAAGPGNRMVASTHNLDDLGVSHPASANNERQQQQQLQEKHGHTYRSAQTAQDKRSRLSNVINNLRKKVPDSRSSDSPRKEEDDRNSVERNLETLEKYVMTVLNGVIKDEEEEEEDAGEVERKKDQEDKAEESGKMSEVQEDEDSKGPGAKFEPSKPNESRTEAAVLPVDQSESVKQEGPCHEQSSESRSSPQERAEARAEGRAAKVEKDECSSEGGKRTMEMDGGQVDLGSCNGKQVESMEIEAAEGVEEAVTKDGKGASKEPEDHSEAARTSQEAAEEKKESRSLGTLIMDRLSEEKASVESKDEPREFVAENPELRSICRDLLNDLLNGINQLIDERQEVEETRTSECPSEEASRDTRASQDLSTTSLHCSLPLDKVASVLQNCQANESVGSAAAFLSSSQSQGKSPTKSPSPTVRHLCLYCDRKFLSISLRQRHTERVHQLGGGRRSERNSRKPSQNCQYCSDKCAESLEGLFQHMVCSHADKYHACVQCSTRYLTREALVGHMNEIHGSTVERGQHQEKLKDAAACKECANQSPREKPELLSPKERRSEEADLEYRAECTLLKPVSSTPKDSFSNPGSPEFDSSFYSSVSCNIRENLLHHLDGKLQPSTPSSTTMAPSLLDPKQQQAQQPSQQQSFYEHNVNQIQFPIDISLTAATPVYNKDYATEDYENSSEYAQKPGKSSRSHPRRVSFEKYNFPRKYDGKEQWTCSIKDLSKFDISTQLSLRKKQQLIKERITISRLHQLPLVTDVARTSIDCESAVETPGQDAPGNQEDASGRRASVEGKVFEQKSHGGVAIECRPEIGEGSIEGKGLAFKSTEFSVEFGNFMRLRKWDETGNEAAKTQEVVYAELTGEWSRPRIYICGACASRHVTLREMEEHKASTHPNVWCSHFEFSGDQRELYKHLFLPGRSIPTAKARNAVLPEKVCTKCSKNCNTLPELHRHMLECGGDQAWLLGLFGNGKKKCKWRPFGSRSRRRRQRGMKRNIQNSQTPRVNVPKEKQPAGPRVRPSDRESIQKMLANLPPKRATRKVLQDSTMRAQGRLRNVQTRSRPRMVGDNSSASRMSRNKAALRNKLLKNAKSIQRNRCRSDNISAIIESVVNSYVDEDRREEILRAGEAAEGEGGKHAKDKQELTKSWGRGSEVEDRGNRPRMARGPRVLGKRRNVKTKEGGLKIVDQSRGRERSTNFRVKGKNASKVGPEAKEVAEGEPSRSSPKTLKTSSKVANRESDVEGPSGSPVEGKGSPFSSKNKSPLQTTPKRKRPVDPKASLNASIKAKSQLRTQDGKFARNPNKEFLSPQKSPELRGSISSRQGGKTTRSGENSPESSVTRSRVRGAIKTRNSNGQVPRRTSRLSSDSDKMPTLEPAAEVLSNEEYVEKSTNDLPILSPVALSSGNVDQKTRKTASKISDEENENTSGQSSSGDNLDLEEVLEKSVIDVAHVRGSRDVEKEQKQTKAKRGRPEVKNVEHEEEQSPHDNAEAFTGSKEDAKLTSVEGRVRSRKGAPTKSMNFGKDPREDGKKAIGPKEHLAEGFTKKDTKQKKEDSAKSLETRSNSRTRLERLFDPSDDTINLENVPFEVKKLLGSDSKEDLLTKLGLTSRDASKRVLRQSTPRLKNLQAKGKPQRDVDSDRGTELNLGADIPRMTKKERLDARRRSPRNVEKKLNPEVEKPANYKGPGEAAKSQSGLDEGKTVVRGRRSGSLTGENKADPAIEQGNQIKTESSGQSKPTIDVGAPSTEEKGNNKRQTRASLLGTADDEVQPKETPCEAGDAPPKKNTSLGKRRGRIKTIVDGPDKKSAAEGADKKSQAEAADKKRPMEIADSPADKNSSTDVNESRDTAEGDVEKESDETPEDSQDEATKKEEERDEASEASRSPRKQTEPSGCTEDRFEADLVHLSLSHLQLETGSSMDSGKENSMETSASAQKLRITRPKKPWGSRRERTSKRSLSNVIGILTEGMNIPVEVQQSVVLTVQTTLDNVNPESMFQSNNAQQPGESHVPNTEGPIRAEKSPEGDVSSFDTAVGNVDRDNDETRIQKTDNDPKQTSQTPGASPKELKVKGTIAKTQKPEAVPKDQSPANDIILDLSRRKTKGKGSFLEKIVSKIAKQKDALLEGEVGSLLDTAADELTNILDEVAPNHSEATASTEARVNPRAASSRVRTKQSRMAEGEAAEPLVESSANGDKIGDLNGSSVAAMPGRDSSERSGTVNELESFNCRENGRKSTAEPSRGTENRDSGEDEASTAGNRDKKADDRTNEIPPAFGTPLDILSVGQCIPNGIRLPAATNFSESVPSDSTMAEVSASREKNLEAPIEGIDDVATDDSRAGRRSKKRSLEDSSPKKSKRKSIEAADPEEEHVKEVHLADIMKLIQKPLSAEEELEEAARKNGDGKIRDEKVVPGKRKTPIDDFIPKDPLLAKIVTVDDPKNESASSRGDVASGLKRLKTDVEPGESRYTANDEKPLAEVMREVFAKGNDESTKLCDENKDELPASSSPTKPITKRKPPREEQQQECPSNESSDKSSKKKYPDEIQLSKPREDNSELDPSKDSSSSIDETSSRDTARRRSSRTKAPVIDPHCIETEIEKDADGDAVCDINSTTSDPSIERSDLTVEKSAKLMEDTSVSETRTLGAPEASKIFDGHVDRSKENQEPCATTASSDLAVNKEPTMETLDVPKVPKKRGRKKKIVVVESAPDASATRTEEGVAVPSAPVEPVKKKGTRGRPRLDRNKDTAKTNTKEATSTILEHFKVPEVSEVLQHTKKRTSKRRSLADEHLELQSNVSTSESELSNNESMELSSSKKDDDMEKKLQKETPAEDRGRAKKCAEAQKLERSSSSGSIDLALSSRTRSSKRKQLSSEDLSSGGPATRCGAESVDNLSEASCASESSYFRKKRFSKKRKDIQEPAEEVQTDASITDSESIDADGTSDRRQTLKRKAKKNISLADEHFDLVDDFEVPTEVEEPKEKAEDVEQEPPEPSPLVDSTPVLDDQLQDDKQDWEAQDSESDDNAESTTQSTVDESTLDTENDQNTEDFQTPKKRAAGNFAVVHTKSGEILIVEKRKKLTKEAARFFCDLCATSFTRKSSLKKHNQSQSHLLQVIKSGREKGTNECGENDSLDNSEETQNDDWRSNEASEGEKNSDGEKILDKSADISEDSSKEDPGIEESTECCKSTAEKLRKTETSEGYTRFSIDSTSSLIDTQVTQQEAFEDELLDEEICKITENMSHDEYVLTDHVSPIPPESCSTPIIEASAKPDEGARKKRKGEKKGDKPKKRNLAEEHLALDTPVPEKPVDTEISTSCELSTEIPASSFDAPSKEQTAFTEEALRENIQDPGKTDSCVEDAPSIPKISITIKNSTSEPKEESQCPVSEDRENFEEKTEIVVSSKSAEKEDGEKLDAEKNSDREEKEEESIIEEEPSKLEENNEEINLKEKHSDGESLSEDDLALHERLNLKSGRKKRNKLSVEKTEAETNNDLERPSNIPDPSVNFDGKEDTSVGLEKKLSECVLETSSKSNSSLKQFKKRNRQKGEDLQSISVTNEDSSSKPEDVSMSVQQEAKQNLAVENSLQEIHVEIDRSTDHDALPAQNVEEMPDVKDSEQAECEISSTTDQRRSRSKKNKGKKGTANSDHITADVFRQTNDHKSRRSSKSKRDHSEAMREQTPTFVPETSVSYLSIEQPESSKYIQSEGAIVKVQECAVTDKESIEQPQELDTGASSNALNDSAITEKKDEAASTEVEIDEKDSEKSDFDSLVESIGEQLESSWQESSENRSSAKDAEDTENNIETETYVEKKADSDETAKHSENFIPDDIGNASSSSSFEDKPLAELLSIVDEKLAKVSNQVTEQPTTLTFLNVADKLKPEDAQQTENLDAKEIESETEENSILPHENPKQSQDAELSDNGQNESQIFSEEEFEAPLEDQQTVESAVNDLDKLEDNKLCSDSDSSDADNFALDRSYGSPSDEDTAKEVDVVESKHVEAPSVDVTSKLHRSNEDDGERSKKKLSKGRKSTDKDSHRRSRRSRSKTKKPRAKIADLTSESDGSDDEDMLETQNKNKIVKSVFGRVFGGEKTDKVKEVLNDWVSKSEDDSDVSRATFAQAAGNDGTPNKSREMLEGEKSKKRHSATSSTCSGGKRGGRRSKKSNWSSDRSKDKHSMSEDQEEHRPSGRRAKQRSGSKNRRKHETEVSNGHSISSSGFEEGSSSRCRQSKKRAEERISMAFDLASPVSWEDPEIGQRSSRNRDVSYELRNQSKGDQNEKVYGSFDYEETSTANVDHDRSEGVLEVEDQRTGRRRKSSGSRKSKKRNEDEDWKNLVIDTKQSRTVKRNTMGPEEERTKSSKKEEKSRNQSAVDLEEPPSSPIYDSLTPSSGRNRSPSLDGNSQTTRDSDLDEEEDREEEAGIGGGRISPLYACRTPGSSMGSSSNSENEEEEVVHSENRRKRSSSEFSSEKVVIRSPSTIHRNEVVTIAPTDAIEDNALDVPREIEATKPRQGKVLNFDEELFVECCSRLKATTENELRGAKKIKLDHTEAYHRKDDQQQGFRGTRDRWRDVESQNSLGSLLESVNQLLGEEMYSARERDYMKRTGRNLRSEHSSRSASPDMSRADNLGYEDSLDVAFEHNNKLRDKIQQRMRESENLIASTFGQRAGNDVVGHRDHRREVKHDDQGGLRNSYVDPHDHTAYNDGMHMKHSQEHPGKIQLDSTGFKSKMNSALGGLLDKALSNLLHNNGRHDHNGSTPMKVLAELACARAPTTTSIGDASSQNKVQPLKISTIVKDAAQDPNPASLPKEVPVKKPRNPIKELFERKKEINERKQQEKSKAEAALRELNVHASKKTKKTKKRPDFPLIRRNEHGGLAEKKKRRDGLERKEEIASGRIKDVYDFDEEESQIEPNLGSVMSYRSRAEKGYEVSCLRTKELDVAGLMTKAIGDTLENGKAGDALGTRLELMIDRKFKELEKFAPKTKGALKAFQSEEYQRITGPMDEFVERKQRSKRVIEQGLKHSKLRKKNRNPKKKTRNAWYENDSSDEYRTVVKTEDVGVGISKSQRTCSKGKQNLFAELSTSSESEFEADDVDYESKKQRRAKKASKKKAFEDEDENQESGDKFCIVENEDQEDADEWEDLDGKMEENKNDCDNKKSESEMSDHPLVIDERKDADEQRNSDEETEAQYERGFELDDLYREDSSVAESDGEDATQLENQNTQQNTRVKSPSLQEGKVSSSKKPDYMEEDELIPLEEALDLLDQPECLDTEPENLRTDSKTNDRSNAVTITAEPVEDTSNHVEDPTEKCASPIEEQEEEPDDDIPALPEKLSGNEKPQKESDNLPLHVFLSRKVQESKKRKQQQLKKLQEEQERILMDFQPTRRQRKCAIGKQGLLAEISSSDEETCTKDARRSGDKSDHEKPRKQKRESKEKKKERYIEKKHEQMIAKEQKAIEEEILRALGKKKDTLSHNTAEIKADHALANEKQSVDLNESKVTQVQKKKHSPKEKQKKGGKESEDVVNNGIECSSDAENCNRSAADFEPKETLQNGDNTESPSKLMKHSKQSPTKPKKSSKPDVKPVGKSKKGKNPGGDKPKNRTISSNGKDAKERRSSSGRRDSDDEELKTTKSWNKVEEGVGVAIGRRKRAAANQLYYWSSSSDEEEVIETPPVVEEEEDDRQEQHGWIVGDSHKRMITMLAMEKQLKEKRRRSEDEFEPSRAKSKKHRNSTS